MYFVDRASLTKLTYEGKVFIVHVTASEVILQLHQITHFWFRYLTKIAARISHGNAVSEKDYA